MRRFWTQRTVLSAAGLATLLATSPAIAPAEEQSSIAEQDLAPDDRGLAGKRPEEAGEGAPHEGETSARGAAGSVERSLGEAGEKASEGLREAGEKTGEALHEALSKTGKGVSHVVEKVGEGLRDAGETLGGEKQKKQE